MTVVHARVMVVSRLPSATPHTGRPPGLQYAAELLDEKEGTAATPSRAAAWPRGQSLEEAVSRPLIYGTERPPGLSTAVLHPGAVPSGWGGASMSAETEREERWRASGGLRSLEVPQEEHARVPPTQKYLSDSTRPYGGVLGGRVVRAFAAGPQKGVDEKEWKPKAVPRTDGEIEAF